jgi:hypothetical protein
VKEKPQHWIMELWADLDTVVSRSTGLKRIALEHNRQGAADIESAVSCSKDSVLGFSFQSLGLCTQPQGNGDLRHNRLGDIQGGMSSKNCAFGG